MARSGEVDGTAPAVDAADRDGDDGPGAAPRSPSSRRRAVPVVLAVVLVGLVAWGVVLQVTGRPSGAAAELVAGRQEATAFFSLDPAGIDADLDRIVASATPSFRTSFTAHRDELKQGVVSGNLTVTASVPANGVALEYRAGTRAAVLVAVDATTTVGAAAAATPGATPAPSATAAPGGTAAPTAGTTQTSRYRMRVLLVRQGGAWLVDDLQQVG